MTISETTEKRETLNINMPEAHNQHQKMFADGLAFLLFQFPSEFSEAKHYMHFPKTQGFDNEEEYHMGDIFQRSLITDTLIDCNQWMTGQLNPLIDHEIDYLNNARRKEGIGGWAYFPHLSELPPDADDLGQIIQINARTGNNEAIAKYCMPPLYTLLDSNAHNHGGFESWIIPKNNLTTTQQKQLEWAKKAWGTGADTEVVANLIYALTLLDDNNFEEVITNGINYIWKKRGIRGTWRSTWYFGDYYGTYVSLRAALTQDISSSELTVTSEFLLKSQHHDGGWGVNKISSPLHTGLALLSLLLISNHNRTSIPDNVLNNALTYLHRTQNQSGSWLSSPFIKMELGRPKGVIRAVLEYGSQTITTNFVVKALNQLLNTHL
ncbi:MAG: hypothetical protein AAGA77_14045 [Bacteroidota bacterium]